MDDVKNKYLSDDWIFQRVYLLTLSDKHDTPSADICVTSGSDWQWLKKHQHFYVMFVIFLWDKQAPANIMALNYCANQHFSKSSSPYIWRFFPNSNFFLTDGSKHFLNHNSKREIIKKTSRTVKTILSKLLSCHHPKPSADFQKQRTESGFCHF